MSMIVRLQTLWHEAQDRLDDRGATMPEYALMVTLIALAAFAAAGLAGGAVSDRFTWIANNI